VSSCAGHVLPGAVHHCIKEETKRGQTKEISSAQARFIERRRVWPAARVEHSTSMQKGTSLPLGEFSRYRSLETSTSIITLRDQFGRSDL